MDKVKTRSVINTFIKTFVLSSAAVGLSIWFINNDRPDSQLVWYLIRIIIPSIIIALGASIIAGAKGRKENDGY